MLSAKPATSTSTVLRERKACARSRFLVLLTHTTISRPPTSFSITTGSTTGITGGLSTSTKSYSRVNSSKSTSMAVEPSSSLGFGGISPAGST